jgi:hypothetical protein
LIYRLRYPLPLKWVAVHAVIDDALAVFLETLVAVMMELAKRLQV